MEDLYWSRGALSRARILSHAKRCAEKNRPFFETGAAHACRLSVSAAREQVQGMVRRGLLRPLNPGGRPLYMELTEEGRRAEQEMEALMELGRVLRKRGR